MDANSELIDIRVGYDGTTYDAAGNAVREQISDVRDDIDYLDSRLYNGFSLLNNIPWGKTVIINFKDCLQYDGYVKSDGSLNTGYHHIKIKSDAIQYLRLLNAKNHVAVSNVVYESEDGVFSELIGGSSAVLSHRSTKPLKGYFYINIFGDNYSDSMIITFYSQHNVQDITSQMKNNIDLKMIYANELSESLHIDFDDVPSEGLIYMDNNGELYEAFGHELLHFKNTTISKIIFDTPSTYTSFSHVILKKDDNVVKTFIVTESNKTFDIRHIDYTDIYINYFGKNEQKQYVNGATFCFNKEELYNHSVNKPFIFNGKTAVFCGDSITKGFINGTDITENNYPKAFSEKVGLTFTNISVAGATLTRVSGYSCIKDQIINANKEVDFIFISGGINDWQLGVSLTEFRLSINDIMNYLNSNYNGNVIWITPINHGGANPIVIPVASLQSYRNIITREVMKLNTKKNMSVVQGYKFNFPDINDENEYIEKMYGDKLHPSELGYNTLYINGLLTALC